MQFTYYVQVQNFYVNTEKHFQPFAKVLMIYSEHDWQDSESQTIVNVYFTVPTISILICGDQHGIKLGNLMKKLLSFFFILLRLVWFWQSLLCFINYSTLIKHYAGFNQVNKAVLWIMGHPWMSPW